MSAEEYTMFAKMLSDPAITDLRKLHYKYPDADMPAFTAYLKERVYREVPLPDFHGGHLVYLDPAAVVPAETAKLPEQQGSPADGLPAAGEEIAASLAIEGIRTSRENVRHIFAGSAPRNAAEAKIRDMKLGLDFMADPAHKITEENIHRLYEIAIARQLDAEDRLLPGRRYRHGAVYVMGDQLAHTGLPYAKLPAYMARLAAFIQESSGMDALVKAAVIHFYVAFLHPYFDGNGRMARLLHLWYLVQSGAPSALPLPFSTRIRASQSAYYKAYTLVEKNARISGVLDVTPFLVYFGKAVYPPAELQASSQPEGKGNTPPPELSLL